MISLRCCNDYALAVRIMPLFGERANAVIECSISPALIAPHWPVPEGGGIAQDCNPRQVWRDLLWQLQPFRA